MIAYSCNLSCDGCISLSNVKRNGVESIENIAAWANNWSDKVCPEVLVIFGGEPCLHPKLVDVCRIFRRVWPNSTLRLITNGLLLDNHDSRHWFELMPVEIQISVHRSDLLPEINNKIKTILSHRTDWKVEVFKKDNEHKQISWSSSGVTIYKSVFGEFIAPYNIDQAHKKIIFYSSSPAAAHSICGSPNTPVLYKNKLYKCPPVANALDLYNTNLNYAPTTLDGDLESFIKNINIPEAVCGNCPDSATAIKINHMDPKNVKIK